MKKVFLNFRRTGVTILSLVAFASVLIVSSCSDDDPAPVNEEEVITTLLITLTPQTAGDVVTIEFYDEDGETGAIEPVYTYLSGTEVTTKAQLLSGVTYTAAIELLNEEEEEDITEEIEEEADEHLFCFTASSNLEIDYDDLDENELPVGLSTLWTAGATGAGEVTVVLRHQPGGEKTGDCPGEGDTDIEVTFEYEVID